MFKSRWWCTYSRSISTAWSLWFSFLLWRKETQQVPKCSFCFVSKKSKFWKQTEHNLSETRGNYQTSSSSLSAGAESKTHLRTKAWPIKKRKRQLWVTCGFVFLVYFWLTDKVEKQLYVINVELTNRWTIERANEGMNDRKSTWMDDGMNE